MGLAIMPKYLLMNNVPQKHLLDLIPIIVLAIYAIVLLMIVSSTDIILNWKHYLGFFFLIITTIIIFKNHQIGTLCLGLILLLGYFGLWSLSPQLLSINFGIRPLGFFIPFFNGQPIIIALTFVHFYLSRRYYFGIVTKKYWQAFMEGEAYSKE